MREFITGNQAVVRGAMRAGCDFFAGYPITPASSILSEMIASLGSRPGRAVQTEDEIAAIGCCIGAAMTGARALTATSGPGLSLYSENIGLAQMGEVPLVIVDCQRMGPATGGATSTGEGDVVFARHVTSGSYPLPVLSAADAESAYWLTYEAFRIAERLRTPVIVLLSKDISLTRQTCDLDAIDLPTLTPRSTGGQSGSTRPYRVDSLKSVPDFVPIGGSAPVRFTGSIHGEDGLLTANRGAIDRKLSHLKEKIAANADLLEYVRNDLDADAETLVVSYGLADGAARDAVAELRDSGSRVSHLTLYSLWPMPERAIQKALTARIRRVVVPELNIGLYADELRRLVKDADIESLTRIDGGLIHPRTIAAAVCNAEAAAKLVERDERGRSCQS
ncbi:MAG: pyruvate flavodoxin/ferredoxin oxidoreductase [Planctomycetota bacterium]